MATRKKSSGSERVESRPLPFRTVEARQHEPFRALPDFFERGPVRDHVSAVVFWGSGAATAHPQERVIPLPEISSAMRRACLPEGSWLWLILSKRKSQFPKAHKLASAAEQLALRLARGDLAGCEAVGSSFLVALVSGEAVRRAQFDYAQLVGPNADISIEAWSRLLGRGLPRVLQAAVHFGVDMIPLDNQTTEMPGVVAQAVAAVMPHKSRIQAWLAAQCKHHFVLLLACRDGTCDADAIVEALGAAVGLAGPGAEFAEGGTASLKVALFAGERTALIYAWLNKAAELIYADSVGGGIEPQQDRRGVRAKDETQGRVEAIAEPAYMPRLRLVAHAVVDEPQSLRHVATLEQIIRDAQRGSPVTKEDKREFARLVNMVLDATAHRIEVKFAPRRGATQVLFLTRLVVNPGRSGKGYIQFKISGAGSRGRLETAEIVKLRSYTHGEGQGEP